MRIFYDGKIYQLQRTGGVNRYFSQIIKRLPSDWMPTLVASRRLNFNFPCHEKLELITFPFFKPKRLSSNLTRLYFQHQFKAKSYDIVHPTYYSLLSWGDIRKCGKPIVISVWDMIHEVFSESMDPTGCHAILKQRAIEAADAIICISKNTKSDLLKIYGDHLEDKISITYLAADIPIQQLSERKLILDYPYFLYVGSRAVYKGFDVLLRAFKKIHLKYPDLRLVVIGELATASELREIASSNLLSKIVFCGLVDDYSLASLYQNSVAFVYPSSYEGFGIPPLEAMMCGSPVITSNASSLPEIIGNAGLFFTSNCEDDLIDKLEFILNNPIARERLAQAGFKHVKRFSWDSTVEKTLEIYRSL